MKILTLIINVNKPNEESEMFFQKKKEEDVDKTLIELSKATHRYAQNYDEIAERVETIRTLCTVRPALTEEKFTPIAIELGHELAYLRMNIHNWASSVESFEKIYKSDSPDNQQFTFEKLKTRQRNWNKVTLQELFEGFNNSSESGSD